MKETTRFDAGFQAEGRVCVQYTDTTGRVREEIRGKNHVYVDQMMTTNWINDIMVNVPLVLTNSRRPVDTTFPYVPGEIIGYGVPGSSGTDAYFGSFRGNESYRALRTRTSCSSKFIYDFSPTQALGTLGHVGLSFQPYQSVYSATMIKPGIKIASRPITQSGNQQMRLYILVGDTIYYTSRYNKYAYISTIFDESTVYKTKTPDALFSSPDGYTDAGYYTPGYFSDTGNVLLLARYSKKQDDGSNVYKYTCYEMDASLDSVVSSATFDAELLPEATAFGRCGSKLYILPFNNYVGNYVNKIISVDVETGETSEIETPASLGCHLGGDGVISFYDKYMGCASRGYQNSTYGQGYGFIFDLENAEIYAQMHGSTTSHQGNRCCLIRNPSSTCEAFLQIDNYDTSSGMHPYGGAITDYRMPDDAPERPEGYGMTVIYELNVLW